MMRASSIVLLSGGLDSLAAFHWASKESDLVMGLTIHYGQKAAEREIESAAKICRHYDVNHRVIHFDWYRDDGPSSLINPNLVLPEMGEEDLKDSELTEQSAKAVWVPNRNGVFIHAAASLAEARLINWIVVGFNSEEAQTFPDNSEVFVDLINASLELSTHNKVKVVAPFVARSKKEIVRWCLSQKIDFSPLWSCYRGEEKMCGRCESCLRLKRALHDTQASSWLEKLF